MSDKSVAKEYMPSTRVWGNYDPALIPSSTQVAVGMLRPYISDHTVLDLGCGTGSHLQDLLSCEPRSFVGIDVNHKAISHAQIASKPHARHKFVTGDAGTLPFQDNSFDLVTAQALLTIIPTATERREIIREARRVVRPGGHLYIGDFLLAPDDPHYQRRYARGRRLIGETGSFAVEEPTGKILYLAHHFTATELDRLLRSGQFKEVDQESKPTLTRTGNKLTGISIVARATEITPPSRK